MQYKDVEQQLTLQVRTSANNYRSAIQTLQARTDEVQSTQETYRFAERRFREGQALQLELIDARTQLTNAQLNYSLAQLAVLTRAAELERVMASYSF
jgi:outer membrane protein TolC